MQSTATFNLVKFRHKRQLRLLLRYNYSINIKRSSLYQISNSPDYYMVLGTTAASINFVTNVSCSLVTHPVGFEQYIFNWGSAEITKTVAYLDFDIASANCSEVTRLKQPLCDIFAIVNYTADSFSDGGLCNSIDKLLQHISDHHANHAAIIDLGVESTRPKATPLNADKEIAILNKLLPPVLQLRQYLQRQANGNSFALSIDTYHQETALWLLDQDIDIINDVSGSIDLAIVAEFLASNRYYLAMHSLTVPADKTHILHRDIDPVAHINQWMQHKIAQVMDLGYSACNLILDPGIGFGLSAKQSRYLISSIDKLAAMPCEIALGHSRKLTQTPPINGLDGNMWRDIDSTVVANNIMRQIAWCVDYYRLHNPNVFMSINDVHNDYRL